MNANNKEYTIRPLTEEEKEFASRPENHNVIFKFMRNNRLDPEEFYDILSLDYLTAVKIYITEKPELQLKYEFHAVAVQKMKGAMQHYYRAKNRQKRMPEGGFASLDFMLEGDNTNSKYSANESWWIDTRASVERQVIQKELYKEFYRKCITLVDDFDGEEEICEYLKYELDLLIDGYTHKKAHRETEKHFNYGYNYNDFERDVEGFRRIFKQVFGI
jgi:hypothetical protein